MTKAIDNDITWIDVVGYEGIYEVANNGAIRTKEGKTTYTELRGVRTWKQRVLKQKVDKQNSCRVSLWKNGKEKTHLVHRVVAEAFIPKIENKNYINHIDGSRLNNYVENLEWCNHTENNNHAFDKNLIKTGHKISLINIETGEKLLFRSKTKASEFLGKHHSFIYDLLKKGRNTYENYLISIEM